MSAALSGKEVMYEVVSPLGQPTAKQIQLASPLPDFKGKRVGFVWNMFTNGDMLADTFADLLAERFEDIQFVKLPSGKKGKWGEYTHEDFPEVVIDAVVDAVIAVVGG
jgi:hypothetical protein